MKLKNKIVPFIIAILLLVGVFYSLKKLYFYFTDGFQVHHIASHVPEDSRWEVHSLSNRDLQEVQEILQQKFYYLAKGHQAYAFVSEDTQYILKFLKFHRNRLQPWVRYLPSIPEVNRYLERRRSFKDRRMFALLDSWKMAFDKLQEENGLIQVQINRTKGVYSPVKIIDKVGREYQIDLNESTFLLQKKATLFCSEIEFCMRNNAIEKAQERINQFLSLLISEYRRGLAETDHRVLRNTGFIANQAIHIDAGRFLESLHFKDPIVQKIEITKKTAEVREWLSTYYPILNNYLDEEIGKLMDLPDCKRSV